jgi:superfamily II DNA/RNA helicase
MAKTNFDCVLVFCRTKDGADRIARQLKKENHSVVALHSNRTQREREEALEGFKNGRYEVLVATDIAARGLDIAGVSHVINYDIPGHPEDYVHRIGRTGRAQAVGDAFTLVTAEDLAMIESIERFIGMKIDRLKLDGFDYKYTTLLDPSATHVKARAAVREDDLFGNKRPRGEYKSSGSLEQRAQAFNFGDLKAGAGAFHLFSACNPEKRGYFARPLKPTIEKSAYAVIREHLCRPPRFI